MVPSTFHRWFLYGSVRLPDGAQPVDRRCPFVSCRGTGPAPLTGGGLGRVKPSSFCRGGWSEGVYHPIDGPLISHCKLPRPHEGVGLARSYQALQPWLQQRRGAPTSWNAPGRGSSPTSIVAGLLACGLRLCYPAFNRAKELPQARLHQGGVACWLVSWGSAVWDCET